MLVRSVVTPLLRLLAGLLVCLAVEPSVLAADRPLPDIGLLALWQASSLPQMIIDGQPVRLTAGAQIRDQKNLIVQPSAVPAVDVHILYKATQARQIERIWILTDAEYLRILARAALTPPVVATPVKQ